MGIAKYPIVPGHEWTGTVVEVGRVVRRVRLVTPEGEEGWVDAKEMGFSYRMSRLQVQRV